MSLPPLPDDDRLLFTEKQKIFLIVVECVQLVGGFALLVQVIYTWLKMRKLNVLIRFMKKLLILVFVKSVSQVAEATILLSD